jgi:hypothetical protein
MVKEVEVVRKDFKEGIMALVVTTITSEAQADRICSPCNLQRVSF